jgi:hypothetical protein
MVSHRVEGPQGCAFVSESRGVAREDGGWRPRPRTDRQLPGAVTNCQSRPLAVVGEGQLPGISPGHAYAGGGVELASYS